MTSQTNFEDRLLDELRSVVAANPVSRGPTAGRSRRRRGPAAAAGFAGAGAAVAIAVGVVGGSQAAYAVEGGPGGVVTVHIASLRDAAGLQTALRHHGIPASVDYSVKCRHVPAPPGTRVAHPHRGSRPPFSEVLRAPGRRLHTRDMQSGVRVALSRGVTSHGVMFQIDPSSIPVGKRVYITTYGRKMNALSIGIGSKAPTPPCPPAAA